jgi:hypothetical protein
MWQVLDNHGDSGVLPVWIVGESDMLEPATKAVGLESGRDRLGFSCLWGFRLAYRRAQDTSTAQEASSARCPPMWEPPPCGDGALESGRKPRLGIPVPQAGNEFSWQSIPSVAARGRLPL